MRESAARFGKVMPSYRAHIAAEEWAERMEEVIKGRMRRGE